VSCLSAFSSGSFHRLTGILNHFYFLFCNLMCNVHCSHQPIKLITQFPTVPAFFLHLSGRSFSTGLSASSDSCDLLASLISSSATVLFVIFLIETVASSQKISIFAEVFASYMPSAVLLSRIDRCLSEVSGFSFS